MTVTRTLRAQAGPDRTVAIDMAAFPPVSTPAGKAAVRDALGQVRDQLGPVLVAYVQIVDDSQTLQVGADVIPVTVERRRYIEEWMAEQ